MRRCACILGMLLGILAPQLVRGQTQNPQPAWQFASDYGQWVIASQTPQTYIWTGANFCQIPKQGGSTFFAFNVGTGVFIRDALTPTHNEVVSPTAVISTSSSCGFEGSPAYPHTTFSVLSATGGLQEALNVLDSGTQPVATAVILNRNWYALLTGLPGYTTGTPAAIIAAAKGSTTVNLVDTTTAPWTFYGWNGVQYVVVGGGGGGGGGNVSHTGPLTLNHFVLGNGLNNIAVDPLNYTDGNSNVTFGGSVTFGENVNVDYGGTFNVGQFQQVFYTDGTDTLSGCGTINGLATHTTFDCAWQRTRYWRLNATSGAGPAVVQVGRGQYASQYGAYIDRLSSGESNLYGISLRAQGTSEPVGYGASVIYQTAALGASGGPGSTPANPTGGSGGIAGQTAFLNLPPALVAGKYVATMAVENVDLLTCNVVTGISGPTNCFDNPAIDIFGADDLYFNNVAAAGTQGPTSTHTVSIGGSTLDSLHQVYEAKMYSLKVAGTHVPGSCSSIVPTLTGGVLTNLALNGCTGFLYPQIYFFGYQNLNGNSVQVGTTVPIATVVANPDGTLPANATIVNGGAGITDINVNIGDLPYVSNCLTIGSTDSTWVDTVVADCGTYSGIEYDAGTNHMVHAHVYQGQQVAHDVKVGQNSFESAELDGILHYGFFFESANNSIQTVTSVFPIYQPGYSLAFYSNASTNDHISQPMRPCNNTGLDFHLQVSPNGAVENGSVMGEGDSIIGFVPCDSNLNGTVFNEPVTMQPKGVATTSQAWDSYPFSMCASDWTPGVTANLPATSCASIFLDTFVAGGLTSYQALDITLPCDVVAPSLCWAELVNSQTADGTTPLIPSPQFHFNGQVYNGSAVNPSVWALIQNIGGTGTAPLDQFYIHHGGTDGVTNPMFAIDQLGQFCWYSGVGTGAPCVNRGANGHEFVFGNGSAYQDVEGILDFQSAHLYPSGQAYTGGFYSQIAAQTTTANQFFTLPLVGNLFKTEGHLPLTWASTITPNPSYSINTVTLGGNTTITMPTGGFSTSFSFALEVYESSTAGYTLSFSGLLGPTPCYNSAAGQTTTIWFQFDGGSWTAVSNYPCNTGASVTRFSFTGCNPGASSNINNCNGTATWPTGFSGSASTYLSCSVITANGSTLFITPQSPFTTSGFSYVTTVVMVNTTTTQPNTVDCFAAN